MSTKAILIEDIRIDCAQLVRLELSQKAIKQYSEIIDRLPEVDVFFDGTAYWLADGLHRIEGAKTKGQETILANIRPGTERDALRFALGANGKWDEVGVRRSDEDKQAAVMIMLTDPEWSKWSNSAIAKQCHVDETMVRDRGHLRVTEDSPEKERLVQRGGKVFTMKTGKIGKKGRRSEDEKLAEMDPKKALAAIKKAEEVCTCTCPACQKCKKKKAKA